jgi:hypothetical protein
MSNAEDGNMRSRREALPSLWDNIVVAIPHNHSLPAFGAQPNVSRPRRQHLTRLRVGAHTMTQTLADTEQEMEVDADLDTTRKSSRKRKTNSQPYPDPEQDQEEVNQNDHDYKAAPVKKPRIGEQAVATAKDRGPPTPSHIILEHAADSRLFLSLMQLGDRCRVHILEIHLDTSKLDEFGELRLAMALDSLHPSHDGMNPHQLKAIKILVKGNVLYTRYSYHLASPALFDCASPSLEKLATGTLSEQAKARADLAYMITSSERGVAKSLLGVRGIRHILITGNGRLEGEFADVLKSTLTQVPCAPTDKPTGDTVPYSTLELYGEGKAVTQEYDRKANQHNTAARGSFNPYPTSTITSRFEFSSLKDNERFLIDDDTHLLGHFLGTSEQNARLSVVTAASNVGNRGDRLNFEVDEEVFVPQTGHPITQQGRNKGQNLGMAQMVRIRKALVKKDGIPVHPTDNEGAVELGWKVR